MKTYRFLLYCSMALLLAACGGGSDTPPPTPDATAAVPDSANQSSAGMTGWLEQLAGAAADSKDPVDATRFTPPTPEDTEPEALKI